MAVSLLLSTQASRAETPQPGRIDCKVSECAQRMVEIADKMLAENQELKKRLEKLELRQQGMIAAFDAQQCPEGWQPYVKAEGRFVLGVSVNVSHRGTPTFVDTSGVFGGTDMQRLTLKNIPAHSHLIDLGTLNNDSAYGQGDFYQRSIFGTKRDAAYLSKTSVVGEANPDPIVTIPPYVTLLFCRKI